MSTLQICVLKVTDFYNAPSVDELYLPAYTGIAGDKIVIRTCNDFAVVWLHITHSEGGNLIESGDATETPPDSGR